MTDQCKHVPACPDVDLTVCWLCGADIIPDPDTHLWRPLTLSEKLVESETLRHEAQFAFRLAQSVFGRWIIVHALDDGLAWSGSRWVPHDKGIPTGDAQVCNFTTREEAETYAENVCS